MRTVSFVDHIEYEFQGNVCSKAIGVGDVDNDQSNELIIGNIHGELHIHKGPSPEPWRKSSDLGTITCLEVGDVCNHGINYLVTSCLEGWCHIFTVRPDTPSQENNGKSEEANREMKPTHRQHLVASSRCILIADIDGDGLMELVLGYSDRCVRSYRWLDTGKDATTGTLNGKFVLLETWQLAGQLSSMTVHKRCDGSVDMMVSQPGGTFITLLGKDQSRPSAPEATDGDKEAMATSKDASSPCPSLIYHPVGSARARNTGVTTEVVGNISRRKRGEETNVPSYCAICTLDGTLTLLDDDEKILWSIYVDHQLFTLQKLDVTGDGTEEVVACSSDGHTYVVNLNRDVVRFHFEENVAAFCAGYYAAQGSKNVPCLIYVTFNNRVLVYYDIRMPQIRSTNLIDILQPRPELQELMNYFNCDPSKPDEVRKLYHWCLYGVKSNSS